MPERRMLLQVQGVQNVHWKTNKKEIENLEG
jgi:hypothetical protein